METTAPTYQEALKKSEAYSDSPQKIKFEEINKILFKFIKKKKFTKYKKITPKKLNDIIKLSNYVRFQITAKSI